MSDRTRVLAVVVTIAAATAAVVTAASGESSGSREGAAPQKQIAGFIGGARGVSTGGLFTEPSDLAVYRGGAGGGRKLFVVEAAGRRNNRIQRLDGHGNFELAWGRDAVRAGARGDRGRGFEICRALVSGAAGCQAAPAGRRAGELRKPTAIAVSERAGDVYVMDAGNRRVQRFGFGGRFLDAWGWGVASGRARFEVCSTRCRAGRVGGREGNANPGQLARAVTGAIAVSPRAPYHVFVGDEGNRRVLEFTPTGRFVRGWGWGVATGSRRFEVCTAASGCAAGRRFGAATDRFGAGAAGGHFSNDAWPRHLAVGADGVVYASDGIRGGDVTRFESASPPDSSDASTEWLAPLSYDNGLGDGFTLGLAIDPSTGTLVVGRDPFGPMYLEEVLDPGGRAGSGEGGWRPTTVAQRGIPFLGSVNGIEAADGDVLLAKSTRLNPNDPVTFAGCGARECNGLVMISPPAPPEAAIVAAVPSGHGSAQITATVAPHGVARYSFEVSSDGTRWRPLARPRYVSGSLHVDVSARAAGLDPGTAYRVRLSVTRNGGDEELRALGELPLVTGA